MDITFFSSSTDFREWLRVNHRINHELIVGFYKKSSCKASMTWSESVDQALCYGWIDGIRRTINEESYSIRFTPRKKTSNWSVINVNKVKELTNLGLMMEDGFAAYAHCKEGITKIYSTETRIKELDNRYKCLFMKNKVAWTFFTNESNSYQIRIIDWLMSAKKEETRQSRLEKVIISSNKRERINK